jgi:predicted methyltransferase
MHRLIIITALLTLIGCGKSPTEEAPAPEAAAPAAVETESVDRLSAALAAQPGEAKARYQYRHPQETLEFFGIEPGMVVMEALPGGGWYSKVLLPVLGKNGQLIGADYAPDMYAKFGFFDEEFMESKKTWISDWTADAESWRGDDSASVSAFVLGSLPDEMAGSTDAVLYIRALHNLARFEGDGGYLTAALTDAFTMLKPGGIVGIVQHRSRDDMSDEWASGENGYLKQDFVIAQMEAVGFEFVAASDINKNDKDRPTAEEFVWRLPPSYDGSDDDPEKRAAVDAIGESNRMTLKFVKPM